MTTSVFRVSVVFAFLLLNAAISHIHACVRARIFIELSSSLDAVNNGFVNCINCPLAQSQEVKKSSKVSVRHAAAAAPVDEDSKKIEHKLQKQVGELVVG